MPPGLGRGTGLAGEVRRESRIRYGGSCRSVLPVSYPSRDGGRRGYARLESGGGGRDKNPPNLMTLIIASGFDIDRKVQSIW